MFLSELCELRLQELLQLFTVSFIGFCFGLQGCKLISFEIKNKVLRNLELMVKFID
jgi:hypothetical protein